MIEFQKIEKTYRSGAVVTPVLKGVSFHIKKGEYVAIMGPSGTGKSTLMNILGCLDKPTAGHYLFQGTDVVDFSDEALSRLRNESIGFVFQQFHLLERVSALRNVMLPLIYSHDYPADADERARQTLAAVGLGERLYYKPSELSGGQQQRVAIARALITNPDIVLADEPTGNLDRSSGLEILAIFAQLHQQGRTLIVITHDESVAEHAQRVLTLKDGTIIQDRPVTEPIDPRRELTEPAHGPQPEVKQ